jgi:hypothetical protein
MSHIAEHNIRASRDVGLIMNFFPFLFYFTDLVLIIVQVERGFFFFFFYKNQQVCDATTFSIYLQLPPPYEWLVSVWTKLHHI